MDTTTTINISPLSTIIPHPSITPLTPLTAQDVFDAGLFGIRKQNYERSYRPDLDACVYRGPDGAKCIIGHSMPDEVYRPIFDDGILVGIESLMAAPSEETAALRTLYASVSVNMLGRMQHAHDSLLSTRYSTEEARRHAAEMFEKRMQEIAAENNLVYTPV
jgi:hypothetical protein